MLIKSVWQDKPTFRLIPLSPESRYVECVYEPNAKILIAISSDKKAIFHMLNKLDDNGEPVKKKGAMIASEVSTPYKQERKLVDTYQEYYITDQSDIKIFIENMAVNSDSFDYEKILKEPTKIVDPKPPIVA